MNAWWRRAKLPLNIRLKPADRATFQDLTGGIPLFLRPLLTLKLPPDLASNFDYNQAMKNLYDAFFAAKEIRAIGKQVIQFARCKMSENRKLEYGHPAFV
jgi:hypothetical protein